MPATMNQEDVYRAKEAAKRAAAIEGATGAYADLRDAEKRSAAAKRSAGAAEAEVTKARARFDDVAALCFKETGMSPYLGVDGLMFAVPATQLGAE